MKQRRNLDDFWRNSNSKNNKRQNQNNISHQNHRPNSFLPPQTRLNENQNFQFSTVNNNTDVFDSNSDAEDRSNSLADSSNVKNFSEIDETENDDSESHDTENDDSYHYNSNINQNTSISLISNKKKNISQKDIPPELQQLFSRVSRLFTFIENHEIKDYDMHCIVIDISISRYLLEFL